MSLETYVLYVLPATILAIAIVANIILRWKLICSRSKPRSDRMSVGE